MKITNLAILGTSEGATSFDIETMNKLHGKSIVEALTEGVLTELGDGTNKIFFESLKAPGVFYAKFGDKKVKLSKDLTVEGLFKSMKLAEVAKLRFYKSMSSAKHTNLINGVEVTDFVPTFSLGKSGDVQLGEGIGTNVIANDEVKVGG